MDYCIDGLEAVKQVQSAYESNMSYKVILIDFSMPVMDGIEAVSKIRKILNERQVREQPQIYGITGHVQDDFQSQGLEAGMNKVFSKPINREVLFQILTSNQIL